MAIEYKLVPIKGAAKAGRYRAVVGSDRYKVYGTDFVLREACDNAGLKISPLQLRMYVETLLESMIHQTAKDGVKRQFGNYFSVRLDVRGSFPGVDSHAEGEVRPVLNLRTLSRFDEVAKTVKIANMKPRRMFGLKYVNALTLTKIDAECGADEVVWGLNLQFVGYGFYPALETDRLEWRFTDADGNEHRGGSRFEDLHPPYKPKRGDLIGRVTSWPGDMPESAIGRRVVFTLYSRGGDPDAEEQSVSAERLVVPHRPA